MTPSHDASEPAASAYERAPCGLLTMTKEGEVLAANRTYREWFGSDSAESVPNLLGSLRVGDRIFWETHLGPLLDLQGFLSEIAIELKTTDGPMPALLSAVSSAPGDTAGIVDVAVFRAHDRRSYENELLAERKMAEESEANARQLAQTLQQSLIPPMLPTIPGMDLAASYRPAGDGAEVGGDWYEVFQTDADTWIISIGDVVGKGAAAAAITAFVRYTIRGAAMETRDLTTILEGVNRAMLLERSERTATVALIMLEMAGNKPHITVCSAGHPLPRLVDAEGSVTVVGKSGTLLGAFPDVDHTTIERDLSHRETVVLFTDGLTEGRRGQTFYGEARLDAALQKLADLEVDDLVSALEDEAVDFQEGYTRDDIAVVAIRCSE